MARIADNEVLGDLLEEKTGGDVTAEAISQFLKDARDFARDEFTETRRGKRCSRFLSRAADHALRALITSFDTGGLQLCWIATGGYGRGMLSAGSSVRVLLLHGGRDRDAAHALSLEASGILSEAIPASGLSLHTSPEIIRLMHDDAIQASALLETRLLAGSRTVYNRFRSDIEQKFMIPAWGTFGEQVLEESLARRDPYTSSPYRTELNLKESAGCLRDVGMLQKLATVLQKVPELERFLASYGGSGNGPLLPVENTHLDDALGFLVAARNELHFTAGPESDTLRMKTQMGVADGLGYGGRESPEESVADFMSDLFQHTGRVAWLLRTVQERFEHLHAVAWEKPGRVPRREIENQFSEVEGKLYNAASPPFSGEEPQRMMQAFLLSQRRHLPISQTLLDEVDAHLQFVDDAFRKDPEIGTIFMDLLGGSVGVGRSLSRMRDCGLLQKYIPELQPIMRRVDYELSSEYTLDEHMLEALRIIDELAHTRQESDLNQRELLSQIGRPCLLRLAILLHQLNEPGEAVERIGDRIGLSRADRKTIAFLVQNRHLLTRLAERHDFDDETAFELAAEQITDDQSLKMLYLMSYADSKAAGKLGWFAWRDALLYEVYQKLLAIISPEFRPRATPESFRERLFELAEEQGGEERRAAAARLADAAPERYAVEVSAEEALNHLDLIDELTDLPASMNVSCEGDSAQVWLCTADVPARFSQMAGVLTAHELNILSAHAFSLTDGTVLDRFIVHRPERKPINPNERFWDEVRATLVGSVTNEIDLDGLVADKLQKREKESAAPARRGVTNVNFDTESSGRFTILDLVAWDRLGLLYSLARELGELGVNIEFALISTRLDVASDVFYVNDSETGSKITDETRLDEIRERLRAAAETKSRIKRETETPSDADFWP